MYWIAITILAIAAALLVLRHDAGTVAGIDSEDFSRLAAGAALLLVIGTGVVFSYRGRAGAAFRHALLWLLIGVLAVALYAFRDEGAYILDRIRAELDPGYGIVRNGEGGVVEVVLRRRNDGHFVADVAVNGTQLRMLVDTGATTLTLTHDDARKAGIDVDRLSFTATVDTANGRARVARVRVDNVAIGDIDFGAARALVAQPGQLGESLLGIEILSHLDSYQVSGNSLTLRARR